MMTIYPHIYKKLGYDPMTDLSPVTLGCIFDFCLAVGPMVPASVKTAPEFFQWLKANPNAASFGSPAAGSTPHFVGALLGHLEGIEYKHVGYRGSQPALMDMMGGNIASVSCPIGDALQHINSGKMRLLGVSGAKRSRFVPNVPTYTEQGYKDMVHHEWFAFYLPAKAKPELVERLNAQMRQALAAPDVVDSLAVFGLEAMSSTPAELTALLKKDTAKWAPIVKQIGFTAEA